MHIPGLPKASVAIHVNGSALHEHPAESEFPMTATSYVESVSGAEFSVVLKLERRFAHQGKRVLVCAISLDGQVVTSHLLNKKYLSQGTTKCWDNALDDVDGVSRFRKLTFAQHASSRYITRSNHEEPADLV